MTAPHRTLSPGAHPDDRGTTFVVVATRPKSVAVRLFGARGEAVRTEPLEADGGGRFSARLEGVLAGALYKFVLDGQEVPDPYARFLPSGVHGPARVTAHATAAALAKPPPLHRWSIYELHVGTFSAAGTFRGALEHLDHVKALGVTAIEIMPVAAFEGTRGWGYDGVALYAPHAAYGEPDDLRALVRAAHERGLLVLLDVVYNHFGPSGNYLSLYAGEYFTSKVKTPWGDAPNYAWAPMRDLVLENARYWFDEFGFDGLRLDATHAIHDESSPHLLSEVAKLAKSRGRRVFFEDDRNDPDVVRKLGADGVWADDFHHQLHVLLTRERDGYYAAYEPSTDALATSISEGWTYSGQPYAPWAGKPRGKSANGLGHEHLVICLQNHDQVGNRALGTRLSAHVTTDAYCAATMLALFLPSTPLVFMGQEWAASTPFLYFSDHGGELGEAVSRGRREEFASFAAFSNAGTRETIPDPEAPATFAASHLRWAEVDAPAARRVLELHRSMLDLRQTDPTLSVALAEGELRTRTLSADVLEVTRRGPGGTRRLVVNFGTSPFPLALAASARVIFASKALEPSGVPAETAVLLAEKA